MRLGRVGKSGKGAIRRGLRQHASACPDDCVTKRGVRKTAGFLVTPRPDRL